MLYIEKGQEEPIGSLVLLINIELRIEFLKNNKVMNKFDI